MNRKLISTYELDEDNARLTEESCLGVKDRGESQNA